MLRLLLIVFLLSSNGLAKAAGPMNGFTIGNWQGGAYTDDRTGDFSHCAASTYYVSGISFIVAITKDMHWNIALSNKNWVFVPREQIPLKIVFDGRQNFEVFSVAQSHDTLIASMPTSATLIKTFKQSQFMDVNVKGTFIKFKLDGTSKLLDSLEECVRNSRQFVRSTPANPEVPGSMASAGASNLTPPVNPQYEVEALKMLMSFLLRAEIREAKVISSKETPVSFASYNAAWRTDELIGGVKILPVDPSSKGIDIAARITAMNKMKKI